MAKLNKKQVKALKEKLALEPKTVWEKADAKTRKAIEATAQRYMAFLDAAKTERLAVEEVRRQAEAAGFKPLGSKGRGKKFYYVYQNRVIALMVLGKKPLNQGLRILGAHNDAPRLDFKTRPLYEEQNLAFLKSHYYGGVRKYHWLARPLALHGVVVTKEAKTIEVHVGEDPKDPVFCVLDLLPHLARKLQGEKKLSEAFEAERMNLLIGGLPLDAEEGEGLVKLAVLKLLNEKYGISEADLISADLQAVPAGPAREVGFDRSLIGAYAQDDRAHSFATLEAAIQVKNPATSSLIMLVDKEEIGSDGSTGAKSRVLELIVAGMLEAAGQKSSFLEVARTLAASQALSADVTGAFDPDYPEVHDKRNAAFMGRGVALHKYTGGGGKYNSSEASAEYMAWLRRVFDQAGVVWQSSLMGKIDEGGGGTIAKFMASHGMDIADVGMPLLAMHAPFEISHKADVYATCQAFLAFLQAD